MASDAFFPFPDCVEIADKEGVKAVIQPGGSVKDELTFQYCNEHGVAMVVTGIRHLNTKIIAIYHCGYNRTVYTALFR